MCTVIPDVLTHKKNVQKKTSAALAAKVICHLYNINEEDTKENRRKNLLLYSSAGLAPSIQIFNSTYSNVFFFKMTLGEKDEEVDSWSINIPREKITYNTDVAPVEEWFVKFNMHHGLGMFTTEGTLLDITREPILQWLFKLGTYVDISKTISDITDLEITKSPCASDVAIAGVIYKKPDNGIVIGVTYDGFMTRDVVWRNLTDNICVLMDYDCSGLALVDIILTNTRLIMLTTLGLFVSEDLRYPSKHKLKFNKPALCGFEMDDYYKAKIWYNRQCLANREDYEVDYISLSFNKDKTLSQESTCFYSNDSFTKWHSCLPHKSQAEKHISRRVVSFVVDYEQNTGIALLSQKIWGSFDGGNSFIPLIILFNETIISADSCVYTQGIVYVSDKANIYYTKAGLGYSVKVESYAGGISPENIAEGTSKPDRSRLRSHTKIIRNPLTMWKQKKKIPHWVGRCPGVIIYTFLTTMPLDVFSMYFDHLGILNHISFNSTSDDGLTVSVVDTNTLMKETDLGFDDPLSPHYVTEEQMLFFHHGPPNTMPTFSNLQSGKRLDYEPGGSGIINTVFSKMNPEGTVSSILVDVLEHFPVESVTDSPCTANTLTILPKPNSTLYRLVLSTAGSNVFKPTDIEKTVVIPGTSSFFITEVVDDLNALGMTTLPEKMLLNYSFPPDEWFLYDFGTTNGRKWKIVVDTCRYVVQQFDDLPLHAIKYLDLGKELRFSFRVTPVNTAFTVFHRYLMRVLVGRPNLLDMTTQDYWDDNHSYVFNIIARSKFFEQGKTTVAVTIPYASLLCDVACIILTLKSSCSYLKATHYVLPYKLSPSDWLSPENTFEYNNSEISKYLKVLPVNYRPPSVMGIAVPLTDNFYNADPSKPRMRDYFEGSKNSGKYKQCANKSSRAECKCADNMKLSFSVAFSDCKEKALRMKFPVQKLPLYFVVEDEGYFVNLTSPYFVTIKEVNNRTNWKVSGTNETLSLINLRKYLEKRIKTKLYNPDGLTISISGSELFHFRVSTIPGVSFCNLFDEFQIYVDDSPLAFPGQYLISTVVAVSIGGILFTAFLLHIYEIQIVNFFKRKKTRNKVESKTSVATEVSSESTES
ncbi:cation channel sperm-associated auxiliary subunit beta [Ahaetulla prasina]|uniref:cation channel sperm-associated auxiliary subunit beta n=1 Tax=Ahaetulla prasina TaxID=499056 RepID=UPI0026489702|nr:cation channel sperm-associated auxiliary subunit beta [Ahaetulla prasina]